MVRFEQGQGWAAISWREREQGNAYLEQWKQQGQCLAWREGTPSICTHPLSHTPPHRDHNTGDTW